MAITIMINHIIKEHKLIKTNVDSNIFTLFILYIA